jgi:hypothetical protein
MPFRDINSLAGMLPAIHKKKLALLPVILIMLPGVLVIFKVPVSNVRLAV